MNKKLFILIIILVAFIGGIALNFFISQNAQTENIVQEPEKEREFNPLSDVPVSNSNSTGSKIVFKSFFASLLSAGDGSFSPQRERSYA